MARKVELKREVTEKDNINQLIDRFYVKNSKKEGEAYVTVSDADWQLAWALLRMAENQDKMIGALGNLTKVVNKLLDLVGSD